MILKTHATGTTGFWCILVCFFYFVFNLARHWFGICSPQILKALSGGVQKSVWEPSKEL